MANKLICQKTYFPEWHAYNASGEYVGRIEKDQYDCWWVINAKGARYLCSGFKEARIEARDYLK